MSGTEAEFIWPVRVYYEDTDAGGVVYYANYLKFLERARTEWLRGLGFEQDQLRDEHGLLFAVSRLQLSYNRPARFNDELTVSVRINRLGKASLDLEQAVLNARGELLCSGEVRIACVDANLFKPKAIPNFIRQGIES